MVTVAAIASPSTTCNMKREYLTRKHNTIEFVFDANEK